MCFADRPHDKPHMFNAYADAKYLYDSQIGMDLDTDILYYCRHHFCFFSPDCLILAQDEKTAWFIYLAVGPGAMARFFSIAPHERPLVGFARLAKRREETKYYSYERLKRLCLSHKLH